MKLRVRHLTRFTYDNKACDSHNDTRLCPVQDGGQERLSFHLKVTPKVQIHEHFDFYLNHVHYFDIADPHDTLEIEAVSEVLTLRNAYLGPDRPIAFSELTSLKRDPELYDFLQGSRYVSVSAEIWRRGQDLRIEHDDVWDWILSVKDMIFNQFAYTPNVTNAQTHMVEVLEKKKGVCQDFAHVMLGICRTHEVPARYVSGYLRHREDDSLEARGIDASHAWVEVYLPQDGWIGIDPTNNRMVDENYVKIAVGRDYADAAPIIGTYHGTSRSRLDVEVQITCLDPL